MATTESPLTWDATNLATQQMQSESSGIIITTSTIINMTFEILIAVLSIFGNGMVLIVIIREKRLRTVTNYCVASLAAADFLVGALGIPCVEISFFGYPSNFYGCITLNSMIIVLTQISIFGLLVIALERFLAIRFPFWYKMHCTPESTIAVIIISWLLAISVGLLPAFGWNLKETYGNEVCSFLDVIDLNYMVYFNFFGCVLLPLILMICIYIYIFHVVRKQIRQIAALQISYPSSNNAEEEVDNTGNDPHNASANGSKQTSGRPSQSLGAKRKTLASESRSAKWFAIVLALFAVCWLPLHIMNTVSLLHQKTNIYCLYVAIILSHANSAMNPILYAYANKRFKIAFRRLLRLDTGPLDDSLDATYSFNTTMKN